MTEVFSVLAMTMRRVAFVGCLAVRGLFVYLAATSPWLKALAVPGALIALGFATIFLGGYRRVGPETGGRRIWWDALRPVHAAMYALFAYCAWTGQRALASNLLLADMAIGLAAHLRFHYW